MSQRLVRVREVRPGEEVRFQNHWLRVVSIRQRGEQVELQLAIEGTPVEWTAAPAEWVDVR